MKIVVGNMKIVWRIVKDEDCFEGLAEGDDKMKKKLWKSFLDSLRNFQRRRKQKFDRAIDTYENGFHDFLRLAFQNEGTSCQKLMKKQGLSEERYELFVKSARHKGYIHPVHFSEGIYYSVQESGKDFLLESQKNIEQQKMNKYLLIATSAIAITAVIQIIDLMLKEPETKNFILIGIGKLFLVIIQLVIIVLGIVVILWVISLIIGFFSKKKKE